MNGIDSMQDEIAKNRMDDAFIKATQSHKPEDKLKYEQLKKNYYENHYKSSSDQEERGWSGTDGGWGFTR